MSSSQQLVLAVQGHHAARFGDRSQKVFQACDGSIGRSEDCDWVLSADGVSRLHAQVRYLNGLYFIEDRSTNGMLLNGAPLRKGEPAALNDGDQLQIDAFEVAVHLQQAGSSTQTRTQARTARTQLPQSSIPVAAPAPVVVPQAGDGLDLSELLSPRRVASQETPSAELRGDALVPEAASQPSLDPLALFDTPGRSNADIVPASPPAVSASWNHTPSIADRFQPPRAVFAPPAPAVLPENWDLTQSQFTPVAKAPELDEWSQFGLAPVAEPAPVAAAPPASAQAAPAQVTPATSAPIAAAVAPAPSPNSHASLDALFHLAIDGIMDVLRARAELKNSLRLPVTIIQRSENNPLKFAPNAEEAVNKLLAQPSSAFLSGQGALQDAIDDIRHHQMAMMAGMRDAFSATLAHFDPARFEAEDSGRRLGFGHKSRPWERYREHFDGLARNPDEGFRRLFGDAFARAYEDQLARLKRGAQS